jgi:hypothetical protein
MKKYKSMLYLMAGLVLFNACLDEDPMYDPDKSENIIEFFDLQAPSSPVDAPHHMFVNSFPISASEEFSVLISYSGAHDNDKDITVKVGIDEQAMRDYNESEGTSFELMPPAFYSVPTLDVTIPKGQTKAFLTFNVNTSLFDFAKKYALPLRIVSSSSGVISGNFGVAIFNVGAKNQYDGDYHSFGTRWNFASAGNWNGACCPAGGTIVSTGPWDFITHVSTVNETTSTIHAANSDGGFGTLDITVNPDNSVTVAPNATTTVTNVKPMAASSGKKSYYDPATKTFFLFYQYTNADGSFRVLQHTATLE